MQEQVAKESQNFSTHTDAKEALLHWLSIAESQICSLEVLSQLLPDVSKRVERDMTQISDQFVALAATLQEHQATIAALIAKNGEIPELKTMQQQLSKASQSVGGIIVGMQFQDWTTQNLVIATNVIKANIAHLEDGMDKTATPQQQTNIPIDKAFAKELVEHFKLGELQRRFADHLVQHQYITDTKEIDFAPADIAPKKDDDNIDLF